MLDANRDGRADLVVVNERGGSASILLGDGRGHFSAPDGSPVAAGPSPNDVAVGDFNRDGWPDLAFANHETQQLTVLFGNGRGGFAPASSVTVAVRPHPHGIAAGDFDGDGSLDLVTDSWADDRLEIVFNDGKGNFRTPGRYVPVGKHPYQRIRVGDLNRDGKADIVSPNLDGNDVTVLLGNGKGGFVQPAGSPFHCGDAPFNVAIGDVNADGVPDLAIVNSPSSASGRSGRDGLTVLIGDGHGGFRPMPGSPFGTDKFPNLVAIGDIDGNGVADIAVSIPDSDRVTIFSMARDGRVMSRRNVAVHGHPKGLVIRDFDGDGKGDIAVANNSDNAVTVIFGRPPVTSNQQPAASFSVAVTRFCRAAVIGDHGFSYWEFEGRTRRRVRPLISKRLLRALDDVHDCGRDWASHQPANTTDKPPFVDCCVFSASADWSPTQCVIQSSESLPDGRQRVVVEYQFDSPHEHARWHVALYVARDGEGDVVDDFEGGLDDPPTGHWFALDQPAECKSGKWISGY